MWESFKIAFAMYSKIPMPYAKWEKNNIRYSLCFFPLVGVVIALGIILWDKVSSMLAFGDVMRTVIFIIIPIIITGGIHVDGLIDTMDAKNSYQPIDKKLEILKDPHIGAFGLIMSIVYFLLSFGVWSEITSESIYLVSITFILSRSLSGLSIVTFPLAKNSGLAASFSNAAEKNIVKFVMYIYILICILGMIIINFKFGIIMVMVAAFTFFYYKKMSIKNFGGITGDLAGYFLQICELFIVLSYVIFNKIL